MSTKSKIWTPENTWRLMEMRNVGKTFVEIAAVFGVSISCVRDRYLRETDRRQAEERRKAGGAARQAVRKPVKPVVKKAPKPAPKKTVKPSPAWTEVQDMMLTAMSLSGVPACDIARSLRRSEKDCRARAKKIGVVMPAKAKPYSPSFASDREDAIPVNEDLGEILNVDA